MRIIWRIRDKWVDLIYAWGFVPMESYRELQYKIEELKEVVKSRDRAVNRAEAKFNDLESQYGACLRILRRSNESHCKDLSADICTGAGGDGEPLSEAF